MLDFLRNLEFQVLMRQRLLHHGSIYDFFLLSLLHLEHLSVLLVNRDAMAFNLRLVEVIEVSSLMMMFESMMTIMLNLFDVMPWQANLSVKWDFIFFRWQVAGLVGLGQGPGINFRAILMSLERWESSRLHLIGSRHVWIDLIIMRLLVPMWLFKKFRSSVMVLWTIAFPINGVLGTLIELWTWFLVRILYTLDHGMRIIMNTLEWLRWIWVGDLC